MSKILLLTSSFEENQLSDNYDNEEWIKQTNDRSHYPIGIAYLHSYMKQQGHDIKTLFLNTHSYKLCYKRVEDEIKNNKPDVLGLQILTQNRTSSFRIIEKTHETNPEIKIVIGGIHTTATYDLILKKYPYITAVIGEGELTFDELCKYFEWHKDLSEVQGIAYNKNGEVVTTPQRELIHDLDILPNPAHELFFNPERTQSCILTTRGCPFACSFCALESISKRQHRKRSVENVIKELEELKSNFPNMKKIWTHDDTFFLDNERVMRFCDEVIKRGLNTFEFVCSARVKPICEEMVDKLVQANFKHILFGLESGTDEILFRCHKNITQKDVERAFTLFSKTDIEITTFLIVGLPGETDATNLNTANFIKKLQRIKYVFFRDIGILGIYPGTEIFRLSKEAGIIDDEYWMTDKRVPLYTVDYTEEKLYEMKDELLNHIAAERIVKPVGFVRQWMMIPSIINYVFKTGKVQKVVNKIWRR